MANFDPAVSGYWLARLGAELDGRAPSMQRYADYYAGKHRLIYATDKFRAAFGSILAGFADNFCGLVVDAVEERLDVEGFRMGVDAKADADAWRIWQANGMDALSQLAHQEAISKGAAAVIVWSDADNPDVPLITVEDAREVAVAMDRSNRKRLAALKRWVADDKDQTVCATLYLPDRIEKWQRVRGQSAAGALLKTGSTSWAPREVEGEPWPLDNPLGVVPVVSFPNLPNLRGTGRSEIASIIPIQDALNKLGQDLLIASEFAAYRQRWATGMDIPTDPDTNKPIEPFKSASDRVWIGTSKDTQFGSFEATDLTNYVKAIEMEIQHIASITRTPAHYLLGSSGSFPSGESLKATETGLVAKARRKQRYFGEGWEEVVRLAFAALDDPRAKIMDSETIWRDPESRNDAVTADRVVKLGSSPIDLPRQMLWEMIGLTPTQIERATALMAVQEATEPADALPDAAGGGHNGLPMMAATSAPDAPAA